jgi:hypothetical protein
MPYREPAETPKDPPRPLVRFAVSRYGVLPAIAIVLASIALSVFIGWVELASVRLVCTRASAGATPRCNVTQKGAGGPDIRPFELRDGTSLEIVERRWDDEVHVVITTPNNGEISATVDRPFAEATLEGAKRFLASPDALRWEVERSNRRKLVPVAIGGFLFVVVMLFVVKRTPVVIDRDARTLRVGRWRKHSLDEISSANVEEIDDSAFYSLVLVKKDDKRVAIAHGRKSEVDAAATAIGGALAELRSRKRDER